MIDILTAKRAALQSSLEQIIGQANRVNGAIAVIDELLQEVAAAAAIAEPRPEIGGIDRAPSKFWQPALQDEDLKINWNVLRAENEAILDAVEHGTQEEPVTPPVVLCPQDGRACDCDGLCERS